MIRRLCIQKYSPFHNKQIYQPYKKYIICNLFSQQRQRNYTPMMPLIGDSSLIYVQEDYSKGQIPRLRTIFYYQFPAIILTIHSYLTEWTMFHGAGVGVLVGIGYILKQISTLKITEWAQAIQMSSDTKKLYITLPRTELSEKLGQNSFKKHNFLNLLKDVPSKLNQIVNFRYYAPMQAQTFTDKRQFDMLVKSIHQLQEKVIRLEIDLQKDIESIEFQMQPSQLQTLIKDVERLSQTQLFRKYENHKVLFRTVAPFLKMQSKQSQKKFTFQVNLKNNANKKYQDYILALVFKYNLKPELVQEGQSQSRNSRKQSKKTL